MTVSYDPFSIEMRADPYPHYAELRAHAPVHRLEGPGFYLISRYEDVHNVLRHPELFSSRAMFTFLMNQGREGRPPLSWKMPVTTA